MNRQKIKADCENPDWQGRWWRHSLIFEMDNGGKTRPKSGADFWFDHFWKPRELTVWIYELMRRLPNTKMDIDDKNKKALQALPPYPRLSEEQKAALVFIVNRALDSELINEEVSTLYNSTDRSHMPEWQHGQPHKLPDWRQVEALDRVEADQTAEKKDSRWEKRRRARERAMTFLPLILSVWKLMTKDSLQNIIIPPLQNNQGHSLHGAIFSDTELNEALKKAKQQATPAFKI